MAAREEDAAVRLHFGGVPEPDDAVAAVTRRSPVRGLQKRGRLVGASLVTAAVVMAQSTTNATASASLPVRTSIAALINLVRGWPRFRRRWRGLNQVACGPVDGAAEPAVGVAPQFVEAFQ